MEPKYASVLKYVTPAIYKIPCATLKISHQQAAFVTSIAKIIDSKASAKKAGRLSWRFDPALLALASKGFSGRGFSQFPIIQFKFFISIVIGISQS